MEQPLVSIVLPTHNGSKYLALSIESCLAQTHAHFELIIVDDCSTDDTPAIISRFAAQDSRIRHFRNEQNRKLPLSLNAGFDRARGKYFTWTSDDNLYAPQAIEVMVQTLENHSPAGLVYANYTLIDDDGNTTGTKQFGNVNENMVDWLGCGACFLYTAGLHQQLNGYDPSAFLIEDYDFFLRALTKTPFIYLERTDLYFYRLHGRSLTSLYGFYNMDLQKIVMERQLPALMPLASRADQVRWMRKFAVYYGVSKNNGKRMQLYLRKLRKISLPQALLTAFYIIVRKFFLAISVSFSALGSFFSTQRESDN